MPLRSKRLDDRVRDRLPTFLTLGAVSMRMAIHAPRVPILLHERSRGIERVTTLSAEEVSGMPLGAASYDDLALNGCFA